MDPLLKKCDHCGFMPNTVAHRERSEPLEKRIAELEAEVERLREDLLDSKHWPHVVQSIYDPMCPRCVP